MVFDHIRIVFGIVIFLSGFLFYSYIESCMEYNILDIKS